MHIYTHKHLYTNMSAPIYVHIYNMHLLDLFASCIHIHVHTRRLMEAHYMQIDV